MYHQQLKFRFPGQGLHNITDLVEKAVEKAQVECGMCNVFVHHTSCSLCIQENADPSAKADLEKFLSRLVPYENWFTHTAEGRDDMPSHIKAALTQVNLSIPVMNYRLALGVWQGLYLWEHRSHPGERLLTVSVWQ